MSALLRHIIVFALALCAASQAVAQALPDPRQRAEMRFDRPESKNGANFARVKDTQCRESVSDVARDATLRRRIVALASQEWEAFYFPVLDIASEGLSIVPKLQTRAGSIALVPDALNPPAAQALRRALRLGLSEDDGEAMERIAGYWAVVPGQSAIAAQNVIWGKGGWPGAGWAQPWSAAFVSWTMCEAGFARPQFLRSATHAAYLAAMFANEKDSAFTPSDISTPVAPGDLVCAGRAEISDIATLEEARIAALQGGLFHCDIVVGRTRDRVLLIGGNVMNAVALTVAPADVRGRLKPNALRRWFGVMKLKAPDDAPASLRNVSWACLGKARDVVACLTSKAAP